MNKEEDYPAHPRRLQSILFNKEETPEIEPSSEKGHDDLSTQVRGRRVTFGSRHSSFSDREYGGPSHHSEYSYEHSHDSEQSDREKWWSRDDDDSRASAHGNEESSSRRLSNRIMSSVASSLGGSVRRSFRSDSDRSYNDNDRTEDKDKDTDADKSPHKQVKRGFLTNMMSNIAPKNPPLHYCILFTVSMLISASVMMGGALVYRSLLLRGNKTQDTGWDEGLSSYPSYAPSFHPSYAPSEKQSLTFEPSPIAPSIAEPSTNTMFSSIPTETEGCTDGDYFLFTIDNGNTQDW